jgi:DNA polymerase-3 subunit gamma/tau
MQWTISRRPQTLDEMYGLSNLKTYFYTKAKKGDIPKSILLRGQFGTGKTTSAKIIAKMLTCHNPKDNGDPCNECAACKSINKEAYDRDTLLIDGGMTGKSEVVDRVNEFIATGPMYDPRKVIIIEEIQELSTAAKNSLLKTLEHPRKNIHFILLSMEFGGISGFTSRCATFNFKQFTPMEIMYYLKQIMQEEGLWDDPEIPKEFKLQGLSTIASASKGSLRQALQTFEICLTGKFFTSQEISDNLGLVSEDTVYDILIKLLDHNDAVWDAILAQDANAFFALSNKILADATVFKTSGFSASEYYKSNNKKLIAYPHFLELVNAFAKISLISKPYLRASDMVRELALYDLNTKNMRIVAAPTRPVKQRPIKETK